MENAQRDLSCPLEKKTMEKATQESSDPLVEPTSRDPAEWYAFNESGGFEKSERFKAFKRQVLESLGDTRPGTMGEYLKKHLTKNP